MRLIFENEIRFLKEKINIDIPINTCFMDRMFIKAMDLNGKWHNLYRIRAEDMQVKLIKDYNILNDVTFKTYQDHVSDNKERLMYLEWESKNIILNKLNEYKDYKPVVTVSGGKDSAVVHHLIDSCIEEYDIVFSNTSNETHHTYKYIKNNYKNAIIVSPKEGFYNFVKKYAFVPTRFGRACCTTQKEAPMIDQLDKNEKLLFFMGMRKAESQNRSTYKTEWKNNRWGVGFGKEFYLF